MSRRKRMSAVIVASVDELIEAMSVRAMVYVDEQRCPYPEEFDGNDLCATHILVRLGSEPVATMRIRWFADFAKFERICVRLAHRKGEAVQVALETAFDVAQRKGFPRVLAHIEAALVPYWERAARLTPRRNRPSLIFSDREYLEVERELDRHPDRIGLSTPALVLLRQEGAWDRPGVLDRSIARGAKQAQNGGRGR